MGCAGFIFFKRQMRSWKIPIVVRSDLGATFSWTHPSPSRFTCFNRTHPRLLIISIYYFSFYYLPLPPSKYLLLIILLFLFFPLSSPEIHILLLHYNVLHFFLYLPFSACPPCFSSFPSSSFVLLLFPCPLGLLIISTVVWTPLSADDPFSCTPEAMPIKGWGTQVLVQGQRWCRTIVPLTSS